MRESVTESRYPYNFVLIYALYFMASAVYFNFISVYLSQSGFSATQVGAILSLGPFVALVAQPVWGTACDTARYKNTILQILMAGSALSILLFYISKNYYFVMTVMVLFTFFQISIQPLCDAVTLEYLERTEWKFGPIRMVGTIGYAVMSGIAGFIVQKNSGSIFIIYFLITVLAIIAAIYLPKIKGHRTQKNKNTSILVLLKNKKLVVFLLFNFVLAITANFYSIFFPLYYTRIGGNNILLGLSSFIAAGSEIPFLLFADKIIRKIGVKTLLVISAVVFAVRWLIFHFVSNPIIILPLQLLHGLTFIIFAYSLAIFINDEVPKELKATGQTTNAFLVSGAARIIGGTLGGFLSDKLGIQEVFLYSSILTIIAVIAFIIAYKFFITEPSNTSATSD